MATSRVEKAGTIFGRVSGLMRAGALKWEKRPLWYDIYAAFPPLEEPRRDPPPGPPPPPLKTLYYPEDAVRAGFYKEFGLMGIVNLKREDRPSPCQSQLSQAEASGEEVDETELFKRARAAFQEEQQRARDSATSRAAQDSLTPQSDDPSSNSALS